MIRNKISLFLLFIIMLSFNVFAQNSSQNDGELIFYDAITKQMILHFFHSITCPHCEQAKPIIEKFEKKYTWLQVKKYEITEVKKNLILLEKALKKYAPDKSVAVPAFFFCETIKIGGFSNEDKINEFEQNLQNCYQNLTGDKKKEINVETDSIEIPILGKIEFSKFSLSTITVIIAALDSFNPCVFFVLLFLLSLIVNLKNRVRMAVIGGIFVLFSGIIYYLFMAAWLNIFMFAGHINILTTIAGIIGLVIAVINVKDYFWFKQGVSLTMSDDKRTTLLKRMRTLLQQGSFLTLIGGTIVLAVISNAYELICTAGFPMIYTRILTLNNLSTTMYYTYLGLYNIIYVIPLAVIVCIFIITMGSRKLQEKEGRFLKLLSGLMMLSISLIIIINPMFLSNILTSILLIVCTIIVALIINFISNKKLKST